MSGKGTDSDTDYSNNYKNNRSYEDKQNIPTAPIDLTKNTDGICNLKCSYSFTYAPTNLRIANKGSYLSFKVDDSMTPPVIYNDQNYTVQEVRLYHPSLHTYSGGNHADAELIIVHTNTLNTKSMLVCVPIVKSSTTTADCAIFFDMILTEVQRTANSIGQQTIFNNPNFSLGKFIPMTPYYSYNGSLPWQPQNGEYDYVVFMNDNAITMTTQAFKVLQAVISNNTVSTYANPNDIFFNESGPVPPQKGEIYIECQPTGSDGEILRPMALSAGGLLADGTIKKLFNFTLVKIFIGALIMILIWKVATKIINGIASHATKAASVVINAVPKEKIT